MAKGYSAMMGKGGGKSPPKPPGMMAGNGMSKPGMHEMPGGEMMSDDEMPEDDMMMEEYSPEQMSLAEDAMKAAKMDDSAGFLRAIHAIMDSYEVPSSGPEMMGDNG